MENSVSNQDYDLTKNTLQDIAAGNVIADDDTGTYGEIISVNWNTERVEIDWYDVDGEYLGSDKDIAAVHILQVYGWAEMDGVNIYAPHAVAKTSGKQTRLKTLVSAMASVLS